VRRTFELTYRSSRRVDVLTQPDSPAKPNSHENYSSDYNYNHNYDIITINTMACIFVSLLLSRSMGSSSRTFDFDSGIDLICCGTEIVMGECCGESLVAPCLILVASRVLSHLSIKETKDPINPPRIGDSRPI